MAPKGLVLFAYNFGWGLYQFAITTLAIFGHEKSKAWVLGRQNWRNRIPFERLDRLRPVIWVHASSLGEFEQARPIMEGIKEGRPDMQILLTFFSYSGYRARGNYAGADLTCYLPADSPENANDFIMRIRPSLALFTKYDLWPHMLKALYAAEIPVVLFSAHPRKNSPWFRAPGKFLYGPLFQRMTKIYVQVEDDKQQFEAAGHKNVTVAGDTRYDRVLTIAKTVQQELLVEVWLAGSKCLVAGSTWPADEQMLYRLLERPEFSHLKLMIVPHSIDSNHLEEIRDHCPFPIVRYTDLQRIYSGLGASNDFLAKASAGRVMVVDTIGMLSRLYRYGRYAYVGGGFGLGIHNLLEAAVHGRVVFFGPNHERFVESEGLIQAGGGFEVKNADELTKHIDTFERDNEKRIEAQKAAGDFIKSNSGATDIILKGIFDILPPPIMPKL
jgi:3-deoxy-D-manno-octulosonic-acid transferase